MKLGVQKKLYFIIGLIFCALFFAFTFVVKKHVLDHFDFNMTVRIQDHTPLRLDPFFSVLSLLGSAQAVGVILAVLLLIYRKLQGIIIWGIFAASHLVEIFGKV